MTEPSDVIVVELENNSYRAQYGFDTTPPSTAVVDLLQRITDESQTELKPLYGSTDPDALNDLVRHAQTGEQDNCTVTFSYQELTITVRSDGTILIRPRAAVEQPDDQHTTDTHRGQLRG